MANELHVELVRQGAEAVNAWRAENKTPLILTGAQFDEVNLVGANLVGCFLDGTILYNPNLIGARCQHSDWNGSQITYGSFDDAHLQHTNFARARLENVSLDGADLSNSFFWHSFIWDCSLRGTSFKDALLMNTIIERPLLGDTNLSLAELNGVTLNSVDLRRTSGCEELQFLARVPLMS